MRNRRRADELSARVALGAVVEVVEEPLAAAEQDRHDRQVYFVDQAGPKVLLHRRSAAADPDFVAVGCLERLLERRLDAVVDEVG